MNLIYSCAVLQRYINSLSFHADRECCGEPSHTTPRSLSRMCNAILGIYPESGQCARPPPLYSSSVDGRLQRRIPGKKSNLFGHETRSLPSNTHPSARLFQHFTSVATPPPLVKELSKSITKSFYTTHVRTVFRICTNRTLANMNICCFKINIYSLYPVGEAPQRINSSSEFSYADSARAAPCCALPADENSVGDYQISSALPL